MAVHGLVMTLGFVGTVIALERAVALGNAWAMAAPALLGGGGLALIAPVDDRMGGLLLVLGLVALLGVYVALWRRQPSAHLATQILGAALALGAAVLWWAGAPVSLGVPWLTGFVVLTIAGERAELSRLHRDRIGPQVLSCSLGVAAMVVGATLFGDAGTALLGAAIIILTVVLFAADVARTTVRTHGLPRFSAAAMLAGYAWLLVAGATWLTGGVPEGAAYDAVIHAVFLGFAMSMIMAHAPIILPAVLRLELPYRPAMYVPLALLHASLALRLLGGDMYSHPGALVWGGVLNVVAVGAFAITAIASVVAAARTSSRSRRVASQASAESGHTTDASVNP
jgi:hypothetical protein